VSQCFFDLNTQKTAERAGFEPAVLAVSTPDFESGPFGHSGTSPSITYKTQGRNGAIHPDKMAVKSTSTRERTKEVDQQNKSGKTAPLYA
tara:strand:+ start:74154 stop:74423 length:270 start_codon:yes stop_codon:yes gene_type:complete